MAFVLGLVIGFSGGMWQSNRIQATAPAKSLAQAAVMGTGGFIKEISGSKIILGGGGSVRWEIDASEADIFERVNKDPAKLRAEQLAFAKNGSTGSAPALYTDNPLKLEDLKAGQNVTVQFEKATNPGLVPAGDVQAVMVLPNAAGENK